MPLRPAPWSTLPSAAEIKQAIREGWDTHALARHLGCSESALWNVLAYSDRRRAEAWVPPEPRRRA
jgi:hypothetical protein